MVRTRFERYVGGGTAGPCPGLFQGLRFRMRTPARRSPAASNDPTSFDQHTAYGGIGPGVAMATAPKRQGQGHVPGIFRFL